MLQRSVWRAYEWSYTLFCFAVQFEVIGSNWSVFWRLIELLCIRSEAYRK